MLKSTEQMVMLTDLTVLDEYV